MLCARACSSSRTVSTLQLPLTPAQTFFYSRILQRKTPRFSSDLKRLKQRSSRRKVILVLLVTTALLHAFNTRLPHEVWSLPRSSVWWEEIVCKSFSERDWILNFRVSRETFLYICAQLQGEISRQDTVFRKAVSVQKRVDITLWVLATQCEY